MEELDLSDWLLKFWEFKLFAVDKNPITVGKLLLGIILFIVGYFVSRKLAKSIQTKVLSRFEIDDSLQHSLQQVIFYLFIVVFTLFILNFLNIPITIFTVLGGALAIGVGFGSQNLVNNFISGIILMIERPIKVGDVIQIGELRGKVEDIGSRSTRIKSMNNTHIVVPNSTFLEQNVLNWTLSDDIVRSVVKVGVAYGSPTKKVEELLLQAVSAQPEVMKVPAVDVLFQDFGDNSLNFEVYYYAHIQNLFHLQKLASDIRFKIDELFNAHNIVIAFPQRDVHLDVAKPIPVQLLQK